MRFCDTESSCEWTGDLILLFSTYFVLLRKIQWNVAENIYHVIYIIRKFKYGKDWNMLFPTPSSLKIILDNHILHKRTCNRTIFLFMNRKEFIWRAVIYKRKKGNNSNFILIKIFRRTNITSHANEVTRFQQCRTRRHLLIYVNTYLDAQRL